MKAFFWLFLVCSTLLTVFVCLMLWKKYGGSMQEGFASEKPGIKATIASAHESTGNALINLMSTLKRVSSVLTDKKNWEERIEMFNMNPVQLARRHIQKTSESAKSNE